MDLMTRKQAEDWWMNERVKRATAPKASATATFEKAALAFLAHRAKLVKAGDVRTATYSNHVGLVHNYLIPQFGKHPVCAVAPADIQDFVTTLRTEMPPSVVKAQLVRAEVELRRTEFAGGNEDKLRERLVTLRDKISSRRLSSRTVHMIVDTLAMVFDQAVLAKWTSANPARAIKRWNIKNDGKGRFALTRAERDTVCRALEDVEPRDRLPILAMMRFGLRRGEVFGLQRRDLDGERGWILVRRILDRSGMEGPVKKGSIGEITATAIEALAAAKEGGTLNVFRELEALARERKVASIDGSDWLFTVAKGKTAGGPMHRNQTRVWDTKVLPALIASASSADRAKQLRTVTFHHLRHTAATWMRDELRMHPEDVQRTLRHKSAEMSDRYNHATAEARDARIRGEVAA